MSFKTTLLLIILAPALLCGCTKKRVSPADYVDPFIGTGGHGHTYPGASMPFGMVQLSPDTRLEGWDGCSGYHASDRVIYGFSHTHLSGTGCSDYGDILVMPVSVDVDMKDYGYASSFRPVTEIARPGYYSVELDKYKIRAELTTTLRAGFHRYTFPESEKSKIIIDLKHRDKVLSSGIKVVGKDEIEGYRFSQSWAQNQMVFFVATFSKPFDGFMLYRDDSALAGIDTAGGTNLKAAFHFLTRKGEQILVKVGISAVSTEGARRNLKAEIPGWDFDTIAEKAKSAWNRELGKITVEGGTKDQMTTFYTALYHAMLNPNLYTDADRQYRGRDFKIHPAEGFDYYTLFSLWDTYRAAHPLLTILDEKRTNDFITTFIRQYQEGRMLPVWELSANETGCMIGYHSVPVIWDAWQKGIRKYDARAAFDAMKNSAEQDHLGLKYYRSKGYIPGDREGESVSKTLEYAYDDWCIAGMAQALGISDDAQNYYQRAQYYKNVYDPATGFMRAKMNESWFTPFDPAEVNFNYTEANAWQYSFYVPQDVEGLMRLMGGPERFAAKLDSMFSAGSKTTGREQADITGLIGQYAHGNEPSHHMAYLYCFAGQPWKTQALVHRICKELYLNNRDGLCGNEDCGQMSSWYVLSALGFYPVTPGSGIYIIGTPLFPKTTIHLENGKSFTIKAENVSDKNYYIQSATLNGKPWSKSWIAHRDILKGGEIVFVMGPEPNKSWGTGQTDLPVSSISTGLITPVPSVDAARQTFTDSIIIKLTCPESGTKIFYTLDGSEPKLTSPAYHESLILDKTTTVRAFAGSAGQPESFRIEATFSKIPKDRKIKLNTQYAPQYSGGGEDALINFIHGGENFRTGNWQGYEGVDIDALIDLGQVQEVSKISLGALQDQGSWIFYPVQVEFYLSADGNEFKKAGIVMNDIPDSANGPMTKEFTLNTGNAKARFIRVVAKNRGVCPAWHPGAGQKAWIFADEITVE